ncbi:MAG TPA: hypothetical protein VN890_08645 [Methylocella sp.]|nr:hypothetical protein [Methylocella sp.]
MALYQQKQALTLLPVLGIAVPARGVPFSARRQETGKLRHIARNRDGRWKKGYAEKRAYQWFFLFICVARSA